MADTEYLVHLIFLKRPRFDVHCFAESPAKAAEKALAAAQGMNVRPVGAIMESIPLPDEGQSCFAFRYAKSGIKPCDIEEFAPDNKIPPESDCDCQGK